MHEGYYLELANAYVDNNQFDHAIESYNQAVDINPYYVDAWIDYSIFLFDNNNASESINTVNKALFFNPESIELKFILSGILFETGDYENAIYHFESSVINKPDLIDFFFDYFPSLTNNQRILNIINKLSN